ncbi:MAG: hypothetical protein A3C81_00005 [Candidatus Yanofskybacteria bacterium RIFCSPHIGHO2_02_FULL_46_19]|nr:MAG: hypothetical protein A3C81_00005 [Candidatus Yanofskybacteria bacterium RIFCSPHIGHO2_02_FULL_46_19]
MFRIAGLLAILSLFFGNIAFAQEPAKPALPQEQVKIARDVKVTIGQPGVWFDYMSVITETLRDGVLINLHKHTYPIVVIPVRLQNLATTKDSKFSDKFYDKARTIRATVVLSEVKERGESTPVGGFEAVIYVSPVNKNSGEIESIDSRPTNPSTSSDFYLMDEKVYEGQIRTPIREYLEGEKSWFLKPTIMVGMKIMVTVAISIDGFEVMRFSTGPIEKVNRVW